MTTNVDRRPLAEAAINPTRPEHSLPSPIDASRRDKPMWTDSMHRAVEAERDAAWRDGFEAGLREASARIDSAIRAALQRPYGFGGPQLDERQQRTARRLCADHLGVKS